MTATMRALANRDMTAIIPGAGRGDEIGAMAAAVQVFKDSMPTALRSSRRLRRTVASSGAVAWRIWSSASGARSAGDLFRQAEQLSMEVDSFIASVRKV
ncbi:hypothetical protein [Lichenicola sp.]|uniref:hypothetical protein n=1 Tax=Lichenicola sp. TaxID=2804529 RepID=UPI003B001432